MIEVLPTDNDQEHITPLAQILMDAAQEYARDNKMTLSGVMSAIGTMTGALLSRAYADPETAKEIAQRIPVAAIAMIEMMYAHDPLIRGRRQ
jgi:hypothetical protein